jgi:2-oxoglutarate dehydrogenase E2 component (dihydrolipoamide succinyltransferase)
MAPRFTSEQVMPTSVVMPQMGESIAEGTIVRWNKKVGDTVDRDEPLFEISTDKVDAEIPSPVAGVLLKITANEGDTVPVDSVVALIGAPGETIEDTPAAAPIPAAVQPGPDGSAAPPPREAEPAYPRDVPVAEPVPAIVPGRRLRTSPVVRRIARDQGVDVAVVPGSGSAGRVTKRDILAFIDRRASGAEARHAPSPLPRIPAYQPGEPIEVKPLSVVRRKIAEHMVLSRRTSAHVHTVFHVDFSAVETARAARRAEFDKAGV